MLNTNSDNWLGKILMRVLQYKTYINSGKLAKLKTMISGWVSIIAGVMVTDKSASLKN